MYGWEGGEFGGWVLVSMICVVKEEAVGMVSASSDVKGSDNKVAGTLVCLWMHLVC